MASESKEAKSRLTKKRQILNICPFLFVLGHLLHSFVIPKFKTYEKDIKDLARYGACTRKGAAFLET